MLLILSKIFNFPITIHLVLFMLKSGLIYVEIWSYLCWELALFMLRSGLIYVEIWSYLCWNLVLFMLRSGLIYVEISSYHCNYNKLMKLGTEAVKLYILLQIFTPNLVTFSKKKSVLNSSNAV